MPRCQLCELQGRRGTDRQEAEGTVAVATNAPDDGLKIIDCCKTCVEETFDYNPEFQPYDSGDN